MRSKNILIFIMSLVYCTLTAQPPLAWAVDLVGNGGKQTSALQTDNDGNLLLLGAFSQELDFDPSTSSFTLFSQYDAPFLTKLDPGGGLMWAKRVGQPTDQTCSWCAIRPKVMDQDSLGNIYLAGIFSGIQDFDAGPGTYTLSALSNVSNAFVLKLNKNGDYLWVKHITGDYINFFDLDVSGSQAPFIMGQFYGFMDVDPGPGTHLLSGGSSNNKNTFVFQLDSLGSFKNAFSFAGSENFGCDLAFDQNDFLWVVGGGVAGFDIDPGPNVKTFSTQAGFLCQIDKTGNFIKGEFLPGKCALNSIDFRTNGIIASGGFEGTCDLDPDTSKHVIVAGPSNSRDCFILQLDTSLNFQWARHLGGNVWCEDGGSQIFAGAQDELMLFCFFMGTLDADPGPGSHLLSQHNAHGGAHDIGYIMFDSVGTLQWAYSVGSCVQNGRPGYLGPKGEVYSSAVFDYTIDFDPSPATHTIAPQNGYSIFISKLSYCFAGSEPTVSIFASQDTICPGQTVTLTAGGAPYLEWNQGLPAQSVVTVTPGTTTVYKVTGTDTTGCEDEASVTIALEDCTGLNKHRDLVPTVYPNPNSGLLFVDAEQNWVLAVYDQLGRKIMEQRVKKPGPEPIDFRSLESGTYLLEIQTGGTIRTQKVIKQ